jgi:DNA repair protein RAD50
MLSPVPDAELEDRRNNFERHILRQKSIRDRKIRDRQDEEERVKEAQLQLGVEQKHEGQLAAAEQTYQKNLARRAALVRDISKKNGLRGFDHDELNQDQWADFRSRMGELQRRHVDALETVQVIFTLSVRLRISLTLNKVRRSTEKSRI